MIKKYKKTQKCTNCRIKTDSPAYYYGNIYCQKCALYKRLNKVFPTLDEIKKLKEMKLWKK